MHDFYINNAKIDWSQISKYSYLQSIKAITKIENLTLRNLLLYSLEKMDLVNLRYLRLLQKIMALMKRGDH